MKLFSTGIDLTPTEYECLRHINASPEDWLLGVLQEKIVRRRHDLIELWRPRLLADDSISELPATESGICEVIFAHFDYQTRTELETANKSADNPSLLNATSRRLTDKSRVAVDTISKFNTAKYNAVSRGGDATTLFSSGIDISDLDTKCLQAYVVDIEDWIHGALMGQVNRGKKKMIAQYHPIIMDDASVTTMPATEDGLITMILARSDYQRLGG